jgi:hypothetical protein
VQSHLGRYVEQRRAALGHRRVDLARSLGYRNEARGCRRIKDLEEKGQCDEILWQKVSAALQLNEDEVRQALNRDWEAYQAWLDEPVPMQVILRLMPAIYAPVPLPPEAANDPAKAEAFACEVARTRKMSVCLAVSRRLSVWISEHGEVSSRTEARDGMPNAPYTQIGAKRFWFGFSGLG